MLRASWHVCLPNHSFPSNFSVAPQCPYMLITGSSFYLIQYPCKGFFFFKKISYFVDNFRGSTSFTRRSCQTVLAAHVVSIARIIAPILPHLAEDVWQNLPFQHTDDDGSVAKFVFESRWPSLNKTRLSLPKEEIDLWANILEVSNFFTITQVPITNL